MGNSRDADRPELVGQVGQPLIGLLPADGEEAVVRYFSDEAHADAAVSAYSIEQVLALAGAWSDMDWPTALAEPEAIRLT